jgi:hypothetical protein
MNFLCILQVSRIVFVLKMHLLIHLFILNRLWTGHRIIRKVRGLGTKNTETHGTGLWIVGCF